MGTRTESGDKRRASMVNGILYPESPETLAGLFASWGLIADSACGGQAILAPQGAWDLTGNIAASAFKSIQKEAKGQNIKKILLIGPHQQYNEEGIYLSESSSFETPLGDLKVDQRLNRQLASCSTLVMINDIPHLSEHSLEILLPLIKHCFPKAKIVPILVCGGRPVLISCLAKTLRVTFEKYMEESLIVVSSTVSLNSDPVVALSMADELRSILETMDTESFLTHLAAGRISASGAAILGALLESGLLDGKHFSSLCKPVHSTGEHGDTIYHGAFVA